MFSKHFCSQHAAGRFCETSVANFDSSAPRFCTSFAICGVALLLRRALWFSAAPWSLALIGHTLCLGGFCSVPDWAVDWYPRSWGLRHVLPSSLGIASFDFVVRLGAELIMLCACAPRFVVLCVGLCWQVCVVSMYAPRRDVRPGASTD